MDPGLVEQVERAREGDLDAFCYLTTGTRGAALAMARSILSDPHEAEDAVQEAYLLAFRRLDQLQEPAAFLGWLRTLVRTCALRLARRRRPDPVAEPGTQAVHDPSLAGLEASETRAQIRAAITALTPARQEVVQRYYLRGLSVNETAAELGLPAGSVKRLLHESRERLRPRLLGLTGLAPSHSPSAASSPRRLRLRL